MLFFILAKVIQLNYRKKNVTKEIEGMKYSKFSSAGEVDSLSIIPLVDYFTADIDSYKTEAGVSYLIRADNKIIIMDLGLNLKKEHPSPLLHNLGKLGFSVNEIDMIFISHAHLDHLGGFKEQKQKTFSLSRGDVKIGNIPVYSPVPISPSKWNPGPNVKVIREPEIVYPGIASIGVIPRYLFFSGNTLEHCIAINVRGKGIVLIIGCGHQTIERIIERTKMLFDEPIYAIIGGIHFPVNGGRFMVGPLNIQNVFGSDNPPYKGINERDVISAINAIKEVEPAVVSLSAHDSSDWSIDCFKKAFKEKYIDLMVGNEIKL